MNQQLQDDAKKIKWKALFSIVFRYEWRKLGPLLGLVPLILIGILISPDRFLSQGNVLNVLTRSAFIGLIAVGATFVITSGGLDLSVGSMTAFLSGVMILLANSLAPHTGSGWLTIIICMLVIGILGMGCGFVNGVLITAGGITPFIATLGMMGVFRSLITYLADGGTLSLDREVRAVYRVVYYGRTFGIPHPIYVFLGLAVIGMVLLNKTRFGRYCQAIGSNEEVARYSAIRVNLVKLLTYAFQGLCVAVATLIYVPRLGSASGSTGLMWELEAIAAVIIGGTLLKGGFGRIWGTIVGAVMLSMIGNILNLTDVISSHLNQLVQGLLIIIAVFLQRGRRS